MMAGMIWVLDFEGYQLDSALFPVEIALYSCKQEIWVMFYVTYPYPYFDNRTTEHQYNRHRLKWNEHHGQSLSRTVNQIIDILKNSDTILYVKGREKFKAVRDWFSRDNSIHVEEVSEIPSIRTLNTLYPDTFSATVCQRHLTNGASHCARHKAFLISKVLVGAKQQQESA